MSGQRSQDAMTSSLAVRSRPKTHPRRAKKRLKQGLASLMLRPTRTSIQLPIRPKERHLACQSVWLRKSVGDLGAGKALVRLSLCLCACKLRAHTSPDEHALR